MIDVMMALALSLQPTARLQPPLSDADIRQLIIQESAAAYPGANVCPYSRLRDGSLARSRSAYNRPGGHTPKCYPTDITDAEIAAWRRAHPQER